MSASLSVLAPSLTNPTANGGGLRLMAAVHPDHSKPRDVEELCEQFTLVCESAVDPLEIASALEFEGLGDQAVRKRYGVSDVFALAEEMYRRVPRQPAEPEPLPDPWPVSTLRPTLHGLLYGLPTVCFPAAVGLLSGRGAFIVLIIALLTSWALSQAIAYLGYKRLGLADSVQAQRLLLAGLAAGMAGVVLALAVTALVLPEHMSALAFGLGLGAYMLGASVLMILGAERLLPVVLAPGVLGSAAFLLLGRPPQLEHATWAALAATPLLAVGLAVVRACSGTGPRDGNRRTQPGPPAGGLLSATELRDAMPSAGFGLVAAGLLVFPVAAGTHGHGGVNIGALLASLPLALSMGAAEWELIWFRRQTQRLLRTTREMGRFAFRARLVLFSALLQYLAAAVSLTALVVVVATEIRLAHPNSMAMLQIAAYLELGGAMFLALLLQAFGSRAFPVIACAAALTIEVVYRVHGVPAQLMACTGLLIVLAGYAALVFGNVVRHAL